MSLNTKDVNFEILERQFSGMGGADKMQIRFFGKYGDCNIDRNIGAFQCHLLVPYFGLFATNVKSNFCIKTQLLLNSMA